MEIKNVMVTYRNMTNYFWYSEYFNSEELDRIQELAAGFEYADAVVGPTERPNDVDNEVRSSRIKWLNKNDDTSWIYEKITEAIHKANMSLWGFDWSGGTEQIQYTEYEADKGGHYNWHQDIGGGMQSLRKMSAVLILNDGYEGGKLEIHSTSAGELDQSAGDLIVFPSYMLHRVIPITYGLRKSLVIWVGGTPYK